MTTYSTRGSIGYLDRLDLYKSEKPFASSIEPWSVPGARASNLKLSHHPFTIRDIKSTKLAFTTDANGFELTNFPTTLTYDELRQQKSLRAKYFPEAEMFLKERYNAILVHIFDATIRNVAYNERDPEAAMRSEQIMSWAQDAHVDQTPASVFRRIKAEIPDKYDELQSRRVRVLNIWRPLVEPLRDHPLAVCDWRSTVPDDYTACDLPSPTFIGETFQMHHSVNHEWWFASDMSKDEVMVIKMYDSEAEKAGSGIAMCTPHCSFDWKDAGGTNPQRESMEIRAIVAS